MMFSFRKKKIKTELDQAFEDIQMNLSNNYKDEAKKALKHAHEIYERMVSSGQLSGKEKEKAELRLDEYEVRMQGYGHNQHVGW